MEPSGGRKTSRQAAAQERRDLMTKRRHEMGSKIRKQKKSEYLARKRNMPGSAVQQPSTVVDCGSVAQNLVTAPTMDNLMALELALRNSKLEGTSENPLAFLQQSNAMTATALIRNLRLFLVLKECQDVEVVVMNILVHLTAISYPASESYYGQAPVSWCSTLLADPELFASLISMVHYMEQTFVTLGNLAGDPSQEVRHALRQTVPLLVRGLQQTPPSPAAAWALTNAIRNDTTAYASTYFSDQCLSPALLERILLSGSPQVATQAAWMVASLTNREPDVVEVLVGSCPSFLPNVIRLLEHPPHGEDQLLPLIQALGNIASYEERVPALLSLQQLVPSVATILKQARGPLLQQTAWLAGCLLCDAGLPQHPSTTVAEPILVPVLVHLLSSSSSSSSQLLVLEEQREVVCALWNALALPPSEENANSGGGGILNQQRSITLPPNDVGPMIPVLVNLLLSATDADAVLAAVHLVNIFLRRDPYLRPAFEEAQIQDALEHVCDSAMEDAAEVAAALVDDFFEQNDNDDDDDNVEIDFGTIGFGQPPPGGAAPSPGGGMGRGRGRGAILPSWAMN
jgi:hypothetical protein